MTMDDKGKLSWGIEVEPPEDMDETHYDIDPSMKIWKSMTGGGKDKRPLKAEEDLDELYHPPMTDLLRGQIPNLDALRAADIQAEPLQEGADMKHYQEPEEDKDDIDHPEFGVEEPEQDVDEAYRKAWEQLGGYLAPLVAEYQAGAGVRYSEPEKDEDELYHRDIQVQNPPVRMEPPRHEVRGGGEVRVHLHPEEDLDDLYHQ